MQLRHVTFRIPSASSGSAAASEADNKDNEYYPGIDTAGSEKRTNPSRRTKRRKFRAMEDNTSRTCNILRKTSAVYIYSHVSKLRKQNQTDNSGNLAMSPVKANVQGHCTRSVALRACSGSSAGARVHVKFCSHTCEGTCPMITWHYISRISPRAYAHV